MELFVREDVTWTVAYTDASVVRYNVSRKDPREPLATRVQTGGSPRKFIVGIAKAKMPQSENPPMPACGQGLSSVVVVLNCNDPELGRKRGYGLPRISKARIHHSNKSTRIKN